MAPQKTVCTPFPRAGEKYGLNDHEHLRDDPLFSILLEKSDIEKKGASKSTLNRIELCPSEANSILSSRYHKISVIEREIEWLFLSLFLQTTAQPSTPIFLDFDATDDPIHGNQESFFMGIIKMTAICPSMSFVAVAYSLQS